MKIEKINDNQIRCTLTREDLENHQIRISELAYGTEKAKKLFRDMMQQAQIQFGFEADNIPLMIEAIPVSTESIILMIVISTAMILFGMKTDNALLIGLIMGVMNVVPYAGPLIGGVMSVFMGVVTPIEGMTTGHTMFVIAGSLLIIKGFDDFVLQPTLYSERVKAHPLEIFIVILIAGSLAGIVGMLLAIPSYTVLRVFAKEFFSQFRLVRKLTEKI